jgi:hypothetical protein
MNDDNDYVPLYYRRLPNGYEITVWPLMWGKWQLSAGPTGLGVFDTTYHYADRASALAAAEAWDGQGDPLHGWFRHVQTGRRREGGDRARESVRR